MIAPRLVFCYVRAPYFGTTFWSAKTTNDGGLTLVKSTVFEPNSPPHAPPPNIKAYRVADTSCGWPNVRRGVRGGGRGSHSVTSEFSVTQCTVHVDEFVYRGMWYEQSQTALAGTFAHIQASRHVTVHAIITTRTRSQRGRDHRVDKLHALVTLLLPTTLGSGLSPPLLSQPCR